MQRSSVRECLTAKYCYAEDMCLALSEFTALVSSNTKPGLTTDMFKSKTSVVSCSVTLSPVDK